MANLDYSLEYLAWDNTRAVTYEVARAVPSVADLPARLDGQTPAPAVPPSRNRRLAIQVAKRRSLTTRELAASGGAYTGLDMVWLLPDTLFPVGVSSKPGDVVIDTDGTRYTALSVEWRRQRQTRVLTCRDLVLSYDLRETVTIERPSLSYNAAGVPIKAFPSDQVNPGGVVLYAALPARAQLVSKEMAEQRGVRGLEGKYEVIVGQEVDVTQEDRVILGNGMYLDIVGYRNAMRLDELPTITCERRI